MQDCYAYAGLFGSAFLAASLFPAQSELLLAGLIASEAYSLVLLLTAATVGNVLGSTVNWALGRYLNRLSERRWFPIKKRNLNRAENWYRKYGRWSLLLSWAPVIGDPITLAAGVLREPLLPFLGIVTIAKLGRYLFVAGTVSGWLNM
ncbi:MAG: DedA family protein [Desulfovibrionaceae bacterium]|nr:DedA family protein [Desulfovibrionaceae bacterium]